MSKEITIYDLTEDKIKTLVQAGVIPPGTPAPQIQLFAEVCRQKGLSPFSKEIHLVGYKDNQSGQMKYSLITGIDGYRKIAARTGQLAGCSNPIFDLKSDGTYKTAAELAGKNELPISCTCTAMRIVGGHAREFTATVLFKEFSTGKQKWASMPYQMIQKVAESFALRKGFDDELSGIGIEEEIGAYEGNTITALPKNGMPVDADTLTDELCQVFDLKTLRIIYERNPAHQDFAELFNERRAAIKEMTENGQIHN